MKDLLRDALTPDDDGRAFTDAVLLKASGALHRRRAAGDQQMPAMGWLERWARPWVVAALIVLAALAIVPAKPWARQSALAATSADSEAFVASLLPADMALATATEASQER